MGWGGVKSGLEKEFDAYIKKTIIHTTINFAKAEIRKRQKEVSYELLENITDNSYINLAYSNNIEDLIEDEKLSSMLATLSDEKKTILKLSIIDNYNSKELAAIIGKSDSRIRHIITDTLKEIKRKYEE